MKLKELERALIDTVKRQNFYVTVTYPDGREGGLTRLLMVHTPQEAIKALNRWKRQNPGCSVELTWSDEC